MSGEEVEAPDAATPASEVTAAPSAAAKPTLEDAAAPSAAASPTPEDAAAPSAAAAPASVNAAAPDFRAALKSSPYHLGELPVHRVALISDRPHGAPMAARPLAAEQRVGSDLGSATARPAPWALSTGGFEWRSRAASSLTQ